MPQQFQKLLSGVTQFQELYGILNTWFEVLSSQFSGSTFPANPTTGQPCYRVDMSPKRLFIYNGTQWQDFVETSSGYSALFAEMAAARGTAATLEAFLDVGHNPDGTHKPDIPVAGWWTQEADAVSRVTDISFSVEHDKRAVYTIRRSLRLEQDIDADCHVQEVSYDDALNLTFVTVRGGLVDTGLIGVAYGQEVGNEPLSKGVSPYIVSVTGRTGELYVDLVALNHLPPSNDWAPYVQVLGGYPYLTTVKNISANGFTLQLFYKDGKPGVDVSSGFLELGMAELGDGSQVGTPVGIDGVKVSLLLPTA